MYIMNVASVPLLQILAIPVRDVIACKVSDPLDKTRQGLMKC